MALHTVHSLYCADVPLRNCSLTHWWRWRYFTHKSAAIWWMQQQ